MINILSSVAMGAAIAGVAAGYAIPISDDFLSPNAQQLLKSETQADGLLSNAPPPPSLSEAGIINFQLIAFNEQFEVAFFSSVIDNITNNVPDFDYKSSEDGLVKDEILKILKTIKAQEEIHALTAVNNLKQFNASLVPEPCAYKFPTANLRDAIDLAQTFTSVVLGTLRDAEQAFAKNGDDGAVRAVSSVIGQQGEQNGFYRFILNRMPSEKPFLTTNVAAYAFSALQQFIVSCPFDVTKIPIPIFPVLNVTTSLVEYKNQSLTFSADLSSYGPQYGPGYDCSNLFVTYLVGQQFPISERIYNPQWHGSTLTFEALFPFTNNVMDGLNIAALTNSSNFKNADALLANTVAAPGLIQVNDLISSI